MSTYFGFQNGHVKKGSFIATNFNVDFKIRVLIKKKLPAKAGRKRLGLYEKPKLVHQYFWHSVHQHHIACCKRCYQGHPSGNQSPNILNSYSLIDLIIFSNLFF